MRVMLVLLRLPRLFVKLRLLKLKPNDVKRLLAKLKLLPRPVNKLLAKPKPPLRLVRLLPKPLLKKLLDVKLPAKPLLLILLPRKLSSVLLRLNLMLLWPKCKRKRTPTTPRLQTSRPNQRLEVLCQ
jgi:hypothetical protein